MARKVEAHRLLEEGLLPSEVATRMGISSGSVIQYLQTRVGEGTLRFSDIYFTWPPDKRRVLEEARIEKKAGRLSTRRLQSMGLTAKDVEFYSSIYSRRRFAGDLYEHIAEAEIALHDLVASTLQRAFGPEDAGFWRKGIPVAIRIACHARREDDEDPSDSPFNYTTLIELAEVVRKNWNLFKELLPNHYANDQSKFKKDLARLNRVRNTVMHPVKRRIWSEDDFEFARELYETFKRYRK